MLSFPPEMDLPFDIPEASSCPYMALLRRLTSFPYGHKLLTRDHEHWSAIIVAKLSTYQLETNWDTIKIKSKEQWKKCVETAVENYNKYKLRNNCTKTTNDGTSIKTKTKHVHPRPTSLFHGLQKTTNKSHLRGERIERQEPSFSRHMACWNARQISKAL